MFTGDVQVFEAFGILAFSFTNPLLPEVGRLSASQQLMLNVAMQICLPSPIHCCTD